MKILTAAQMQDVDRATTEIYGVPSLTLMENAGRSVVMFLHKRFSPLGSQEIVILCGKGNNGGDGMVVARVLRESGHEPRVLLLAEPETLRGDAEINYRRLAEEGLPLTVPDHASWQEIKGKLSNATLVVDAILGTGISKPLSGFLLDVVRDIPIAFPRAKVVAVDLPTGLAADSGGLIGECARADASVTFTAPKIAHIFPPACEKVGDWVVRPIGTPPEALAANPDFFLNLLEPHDLEWLVKPRKLEAHKGNFGHVLVIGGSVGKTGAAAMAAKAALRAGAGLATVATPKSALPVIASLSMEIMTEPLPETSAGTIAMSAIKDGPLDTLVEGKSVLAVGPGAGRDPETAELIREVVNRYELPVVLDADGLNAFAGCIATLLTGDRVRVLTPHPGEMGRLAGEKTSEIVAHRVDVARRFAQKNGVQLVLKGFRTLTAAPGGQVWVNPTGNPGMATGGSGDVLTGITAALLAQYPDRSPTEVTAAAVYLHGLAGDIAARKLGEASVIAGDILESLPRAFREIQRQLYC
ncbi:MAG: NAD(P)H-hydrate dehydratase [Acidobacteria bacterium]|nr:MAG: NAD(P)H-hydrate dehydratase [Acidobacteriota bacterium]